MPRMMDREKERLRIEKEMKQKTLFEGKGVIYELIAESEKNLEQALRMARKNRKMKDMIPDLSRALTVVRSIK